MNNFEVAILYSGLSYLFVIFLLKSEKINKWDYIYFTFAPIYIPIIIVFCFFKVIFND